MDADETVEPEIWRQPEIIHGLASMVENAVDFARANVVLTAQWDDRSVTIAVCDDGPGFSSEILPRLGEPYVTSRPPSAKRKHQLGIEHDAIRGGMGLGFFIAKTLLELTGGQVSFGNHGRLSESGLESHSCDHLEGAVVAVTWPRQDVEATSASEADTA
jgi:two-component system sensor histidine kinase RegB